MLRNDFKSFVNEWVKTYHKVINGHAVEIYTDGIHVSPIYDGDKIGVKVSEITDVRISIDWGETEYIPTANCEWEYNEDKSIHLYPDWNYYFEDIDCDYPFVDLFYKKLIEDLKLFDQ